MKLAYGILGTDKAGHPNDRRLHVCLLGVLWELAHEDGILRISEWYNVDKFAKQALDLCAEETDHIIEMLNILRSGKTQFYDFIDTINEQFSLSQREYLFSSLKQLAMS